MIWFFVGLAELVYYIYLKLFASEQHLILLWLFLAIASAAAGSWQQWRKRHPAKKKSLWLRTFVITTLALTLILVGVVLGRMIVKMIGPSEKPYSFIVVPCQSEAAEETPEEWEKRMEKAMELLTKDPNLKVIVSGGWDSQTGTSMAYEMYRYLIDGGIRVNRIYWENHIGSTKETMIHVKSIVGIPEHGVGILTSNYFSYRISRIVKNVGMWNTEIIPVETDLLLLPHRMAAELLFILYSKFMLV